MSNRPEPEIQRLRADPARRSLLLSVLAALLMLLPNASAFARDESERTPIDLDLYEALLQRHTRAVSDLAGTRVDYRSLKDSEDWKELVAQVRTARPSRLERRERLAFWINAYNILTIDLILEHHPVESIRDIGSFFSPVWDVPVARIEGRELSLGEIEHEILRKMGEPRIHAAIVCASTSCPSLARSPFRPGSLDEDLDRAMRRWLDNPRKGVAIDRSRGRVTVSRIFDWFAEDFEARGGVLDFIAAYLPPDEAAWLRGPGRNAKIRYFDYDWSLNDLGRGGAEDAASRPGRALGAASDA